MHNIIKVIFLFIFMSAVGYSQTASEYFELGRKAYERKDYSLSVENFEASAKLSPDFSVFHNLGNSYLKLGKYGYAELNYLRAFCLNPRSADTNANLLLLQKEKGIYNLEQSYFARFAYELSLSEWYVIAFVSFWGALCFFILPYLFFKQSIAFLFVASMSLIIFIVSIASMISWKKIVNSAIAVSDDVVLKLSPAEDAPPCASMFDGQIAHILKRYNGYVFVTTHNNKAGWTNSKNLIAVE